MNDTILSLYSFLMCERKDTHKCEMRQCCSIKQTLLVLSSRTGATWQTDHYISCEIKENTDTVAREVYNISSYSTDEHSNNT